MIRRIGLAVLASTFVGAPVLATSAQAQTYRVTSIHQIAPNTLRYLLSHWSGAGNLESKLRAVEARLSLKGGSIVEGPEGHEGKEGPAGAIGPAGSQGIPGIPGESIEGPEGKASDVAGPAGEQGIQGIQGEAGPEGVASEVPGPAGPQGERGPACEVKVEPACASTVPGPEGKEGPAGPAGPQGEVGHRGAPGEAGPVGATGPAGPQGPVGPEGKGGAPSAYVSTGFTTGLFWNGTSGVGQSMMNLSLPAGQYAITGNITFSTSGTEYPAQLTCTVSLAGKVLETSPDVVNRGTAAALIVASTGETTGGNLEVYCAPVSGDGFHELELTKATQASLAAIGVTFH
jgi:hypothetical protein